ncbi:MAG: hypothetical protein KC549_11620, partial [Myxococcales bacterium]|nr:hypothetical protein [Myxococcales bacterium]
MAVNDDERLFGPLGEQIQPRPFDDEGPTLRLFVEAIADEPDSLVSGHALPREGSEGERDAVAGGRVRVRVEAVDSSGVALTEDGQAAIGLEAIGDFADGLLQPEVEPTLPGVQLERRRGYVLDLSRLPPEADGSRLRLQATATDLLARESDAVFLLSVDQSAPTIRVVPPAGVRVHGEAWWTNLRTDDERFEVDIQDVDQVEWSVRLTGEREQAGGPEVFGQRDFALPLQNRDEGTLTLEVSATDRVGRTTTLTRPIHIDRTPPVAQLQTTAYIDERDATATLGPDGLPTIHLGQQIATIGPDSEFPLRINKIQLRLGPDDPNLPSLAYRVSDGRDDCEECPHTPVEELHLGTDGDPGIAFSQRDGDVLTLPLHAGVLGIEPQAVPDADMAWRRTFVLEDLAGNRTQVPAPALLLAILPPPLVIEPVVVDDALSLDTLTFENIGPAILAGSTVILRRFRITNPWPVPVSYRFAAPEPAEITATTAIRPKQLSHVLGERPDGYVIDPGCLAGGDGQPNSALEALPRIDQRVEGGREVTALTPLGCLDRRSFGAGEKRMTAPTRVQPAGGAPVFSWQLAPAGSSSVLEIAARLDRIEGADVADLRALLQRSEGDWTYARQVDDLRILLWNQGVGCPRLGPQLCRLHGWWFTWRVEALTGISVGVGDQQLSLAAACNDEACDRRAHATQIFDAATAVRSED